jgi:hypothetical protein
MKASLLGLLAALLLVIPPAGAQSSGGDPSDSSDSGLADNSPADNATGGAVQERAPGRWIDAARARHRDLADARLAAQRSGDTSSLAPEPISFGAADSLGGLLGGSLTDLISTFLGSGLGGSIATPTAGGQNGGTTGGGGDFSNLPPEVIQMLAGAGISLSDLNQKSIQDSGDSASDKTADRAQTSDSQTERDFRVRWADAMLSTIFTSVAVALQSQDVIDGLKDLFRPLFTPPETDTDSDAGDGTPSDGDDGDGDGGGGGGSGDDGGGDPLI